MDQTNILESLGLAFMLDPVFMIVYSIVFPYTIIFLITDLTTAELSTLDESSRRNYRDRVFNAFLMVERQWFNHRDIENARQLAAQSPNFQPFLGKSAANNTDIKDTFVPDPSKVQFSNRNRAYDSVPLMPVLYIIGALIMNDYELRTVYIRCITPNTMVPTVFNEWMKSCRDSTNFSFVFKIQLFREGWSTFLKAFELEGTYWDPSYLATDVGMTSLLNDLAWISQIPNYMAFEKAMSFAMNGGNVVTAAGIHTNFRANGAIFQKHATCVLPKDSEPVIKLDAFLHGRKLCTGPFAYLSTLVQSVLGEQVNVLDANSLIGFMCFRMAGKLHNWVPNRPNSNPPPVVNTTNGRRGNQNINAISNASAAFQKSLNQLRASLVAEIAEFKADLKRLSNKILRSRSFKRAHQRGRLKTKAGAALVPL